LAEFGLDLDVYLVNGENQSLMYTLDELLPSAFSPRDLIKKLNAEEDAEQQN
jgi:cytidine deaminase